MKKNDFNELLASVKEAGSIKRGESPASRSFEFSPPNIKKVRRSLNVTQEAFSRMIGVSVDTLQNWEQGRREPVPVPVSTPEQTISPFSLSIVTFVLRLPRRK